MMLNQKQASKYHYFSLLFNMMSQAVQLMPLTKLLYILIRPLSCNTVKQERVTATCSDMRSAQVPIPSKLREQSIQRLQEYGKKSDTNLFRKKKTLPHVSIIIIQVVRITQKYNVTIQKFFCKTCLSSSITSKKAGSYFSAKAPPIFENLDVSGFQTA